MASDLTKFNQTIRSQNTLGYLNDVLGERKQSFVSNLVALVSNNAKLQECEPATIMFAALKATALNLPLDQNLGYAYVIPFKDNNQGITVAQFMLGKNGFVQLALRSGQFAALNVSDVREGEIIGNNRLTGDIKFDWKEEREDLKVTGFVAYMRLTSGLEKSLYMTVKEIEAHGKRYSKSYTYGVWKDNFGAMAEKTVVKRLLSKYAPLSVEMQQAVTYDQAVITDADKYHYPDKGITEASPEQTDKAAEIINEALNSKVKPTETKPEPTAKEKQSLFDAEKK